VVIRSRGAPQGVEASSSTVTTSSHPFRWEERLFRDRWLANLRAQGLTRAQAAEMVTKRRRNKPCFDTLEEHRTSMAAAGFRREICPWVYAMAGV